MIEAQNLTKRYGSTAAVDRIVLHRPAGPVTGFLGPNGAGKSTTMRMIMGLDRPTAGTVRVNGQPYASSSARCIRSARCWRRGPCTRAAAPTTTCSAWPRATASARRVDEVLGTGGAD